MTRDREVKRAGDVLSRIIESLRLGPVMAGWRAVEAWDEIAGPDHAGHTRAVRFSSGRLFVQVDSSARIARLSMEKPRLLERIGEKVGSGIVRDLMFVMSSRSTRGERT